MEQTTGQKSRRERALSVEAAKLPWAVSLVDVC